MSVINKCAVRCVCGFLCGTVCVCGSVLHVSVYVSARGRVYINVCIEGECVHACVYQCVNVCVCVCACCTLSICGRVKSQCSIIQLSPTLCQSLF